MGETMKRAENYSAQNLLDTIFLTREFLQGALDARGPCDNEPQSEARLRHAVEIVIEALTPHGPDTRDNGEGK